MRRCPPKTAHFVPQNCFFWPKTAPKPTQNGQTKATGPTFHVRLICPVPKSTFLPSSSTICPRNRRKTAKNGLNVRCLCQTSPKTKKGPYLGLGGSTTNSEGTYSSRNPPLFVVSKPQNYPTRRLDPCTSGHLVVPEGSAARAQRGPTVGPPGSPGRKKMVFSKVVPRPLGMLKQVFLLRFERTVARLGPWKIPKCLVNGSIWDQKGVKNGSKTHFSKSDPTPFGMLKQVFLAHFEPVVMRFGPYKIPKWAVLGSKMGQKWVKNAFYQK